MKKYAQDIKYWISNPNKKSFLKNQVELLDTNIVEIKMKSTIFITHSRIVGYS